MPAQLTSPSMGPSCASAAATAVATLPASVTSSANGAAAPPAAPPSMWILASKNNIDASQTKVDELLEKFKPLRAQKYVEKSDAATQPAPGYVVEITTEAAGQTTRHTLRLTDPGESRPVIGHYNDLTFELDRSILQSLTTDFGLSEPQPAALGPTNPT